MPRTIRIIRTSNREKSEVLPSRIEELEQAGFKVLYEDVPDDPQWPYVAGSVENRARALTQALLEPESDVVLCARGGFGASDLLDHLPWAELERSREKLVVGFSDVSAIHSALYARIGWQGLHGPMPATVLWRRDNPDVLALLKLCSGRELNGSLELTPLEPNQAKVEGWLFGGCFAVLTNLLGTPYFPRSLDGAVLFLEDTGEHPARLMRYWTQWLQSGVLKGVRALILGNINEWSATNRAELERLYREFYRRSGIPTFVTPAFGHVTPNFPLLVGANVQVSGDRLVWRQAPTQGKARA